MSGCNYLSIQPYFMGIDGFIMWCIPTPAAVSTTTTATITRIVIVFLLIGTPPSIHLSNCT